MWCLFRPSTERVYWLLLTLTKDKNKNHRQKSTSTRMHAWSDHGFVIGIKKKKILKAKRFFFKGKCCNRIVQWINKSNHEFMILFLAAWTYWTREVRLVGPCYCTFQNIFVLQIQQILQSSKYMSETSTWYNACDHYEKNWHNAAFGKLGEWNNNRFLNFLLHYWVFFFSWVRLVLLEVLCVVSHYSTRLSHARIPRM